MPRPASLPTRLRDVYGPPDYTKEDIEALLKGKKLKPVGFRLAREGELFVCPFCRPSPVWELNPYRLHTAEAMAEEMFASKLTTTPVLIVEDLRAQARRDAYNQRLQELQQRQYANQSLQVAVENLQQSLRSFYQTNEGGI